MKFVKTIAPFLILATAPSCVTVGQYFRDKGLSRAAFDLGCPSEQLKVH